MNYEEWKSRVNRHIGNICGMSADDLPDVNYRDMYDSGCSPKEAANEALENAGMEELLDL